jgi:hypothetical protein
VPKYKHMEYYIVIAYIRPEIDCYKGDLTASKELAIKIVIPVLVFNLRIKIGLRNVGVNCIRLCMQLRSLSKYSLECWALCTLSKRHKYTLSLKFVQA